MQQKPKTRLARKKIKNINEKDKALTLFNIASLALMINTGTTGIIRAIGNLNADNQEPLSAMQIGTEISTLLVTSIFIFLAIAANKLAKSKKHDEFTVKAHELKHQDKIEEKKESAIWETSKTIIYIDTTFTVLTALLASTFLIFGAIALIYHADGFLSKTAKYEIIAYGAYSLAVFFTLLNKLIGDKLQSRIEKRYLEENKKDSLVSNKMVNKLSSFIYRLFTALKFQKGKKKLPIEK